MNDKVNSLETDLALLKSEMQACQEGLHKDIEFLKQAGSDLPVWLKNSAVVMLMTMMGQIMTTIWWAASITANLANVTTEVHQNTKFRMEYPAMHQEVMVELKGIKTNSKHLENMLKELKNKLRFVDLKQQVKDKGL
jgi:uncharacterized protein YlxW (UPF0749 family)